MENQEDLTNEGVKKKFESQFKLVGHAIKLAENMIKTGRGPRLKSESQNVAVHVLDEIKAGVDKFEDIPKEPSVDYDFGNSKSLDKKEFAKNENGKSQERKRTRKILVD
ncbi:MAG TPA: hypothetical protein PLC42_07465 [Parachlamydiaceae bacterium]|nr:hypothetical protein [Parachlamydiaceae bacterium]